MELANNGFVSIPVKNAGLVLVNGFYSALFERAGLLTNSTFSGFEQRQAAVVLLNYLVFGQTIIEEAFLPLNKLLCGIPLSLSVNLPDSLSSEQKTLADGLLHAAISQWPACGDMSINGFRGNWLVRDGMLSESDERWELKVDKRAYDILLLRSPYSFSIILFPWMEKPLYVNWLY